MQMTLGGWGVIKPELYIIIDITLIHMLSRKTNVFLN